MDRKLRKTLDHWLEAERSGAEEGAERALAVVFRRLGRGRPAPGFARRVLTRTGVRRRPRPLVPKWALRGGLAAALFLAATSLAFVPAALTALVSRGDRVMGTAIGLFAAASERLAHGLTAWGVVARISRAVVEGVVDPPVMATLALGMLMSLFAFSWLSQLLALERSTGNV